MMEHLPASSADAIRESRRLVNEADIYVGVFAHRYGYVPAGHHTSITEMEYELAKQRGIERSIFIMADDHPIVIQDVELGAGAEKLASFKERLRAENIVSPFHSPEDLSAGVIFSLSQYVGPATEAFRLDGAKHELYKALVARSPDVGTMYFGALMALAHESNPDRFALAAHGLRELMEKLPRYLDVPVIKKGPSLTERVRSLEERRKITITNSTSRDVSGWQGEIDDHLRRFLQETDNFFEDFSTDYATRRRRAATTLRGLDPSALALPEQLEQSNISKWQNCNDYFQGVSHHTRVGGDEDFAVQLSELETMLLDRLVPRTSEDFATIDDLIKEGDAGGTA